MAARTAAGLHELFALAMIPQLTLPLLAPAVGTSYGIGAALVHGLCLFAASAVSFGVALLLSTVFGDPWRPLLFALAIAFGLAVAGTLVKAVAWSLYSVMSGETYFRSGSVPWGGLALSAAAARSRTAPRPASRGATSRQRQLFR